MSSAAPAPLSLDIRVGNEFKSPYKWAAELAPPGKVVEYKNAMLWLEGEGFADKEEFLAKVERAIKYMESEAHEPEASSVPPPQPEVEQEKEPAKEDGGTGNEGFHFVKKKAKKLKGPAVKWTRQQLAKGIVDQCLVELDRTFKYAGPSLHISDVYPKFDAAEFTFPQLIGAVRDEIQKLPQPSTRYSVPKSARYNAAGSPGKGKNFNFKVQRKDPKVPNGWSAAAQIHVIWD